jgi:hypothetical protein
MPPDIPQPVRLILQAEILGRSNLHHQAHVTVTPTTLAVKGGTIGREMAGKFGLKVAS